jgi:hypothetical protein
MDKTSMIIGKVTDRLKGIWGIEAIVLGGSRARGTDTAGSDIDLGIYYGNEDLLDMPALECAASELDDQRRGGLIAPPGGWGNWVNGGGWLMMDDIPVDLILRDFERVKKAVEDCREGNITVHYQTGHPHAYLNAMYRGELAVSKLLWDKSGAASALQECARPYPSKMKSAILNTFGFEASFSCMLAQKYACCGDAYYVTAHIVRAVSCMNQVLFAQNEQYCLNEKKAVGMIDTFPVRPDGYKNRVEHVFALGSTDPAEACRILEQLIREAGIMSPA